MATNIRVTGSDRWIRMVGRIILGIDSVWFFVWLITAIWVEVEAAEYSVEHILLAFHLTAIVSVMYVLDANEKHMINMAILSPLALLLAVGTDIRGLAHIVRHPEVTNMAAYQIHYGLIVSGFILSSIAFLWHASFIWFPEIWGLSKIVTQINPKPLLNRYNY